MNLNIEAQKRNFKNHKATLTDLGNIKILDFKDPESNHYRIRFMFEEDYYRCHITGDLGSLVATNACNMTLEKFSDFIHSPGYFEEKIDCAQRPLHTYDEDAIRDAVTERLKDLDYVPEFDFDTIEDKVDEIMEDFDERTGLGSRAYDIMYEIDPDCHEYLSDLGKESTGILELYLMAFELAMDQIEKQAAA